MSIAKKVAFNTAAQVTGKAINIFLTLFLVRYLTSYLQVRGFGEYTTAITYAGIFSVIADFGLSTIVVRELSLRKENLEKYLGNVLVLRMIAGLVVLLLAVVVFVFFPYSSELKLAIIIAAIASYISGLNQVFVGVFQSNLQMQKAAFSDVIGRVVIFIITLLFIKLEFGLGAILSAMVIGNTINLLLSWIMAGAYIKPDLKIELAAWKQIFMEMLPMGTVMVLAMIYNRLDMVALSVLKGSEATGIYGVAYKYVDILILLPCFFMGAVFPFIVKYYNEDREKLQVLLQRATDVLLVFSLPMAIFISMFSVNFVRILAPGSEFQAAAWPLQVLAWGLAFSYLAQMPNYTLIAIKKQTILIWLYVGLIAENLILNWIFIPQYSYQAAAVITVITEALAFIFSWWFLYKNSEFKPQIRIMGKILAAGLALAGVLFLLKSSFLAALAGGVLAYGLMLVLLKTFSFKRI